MHGRVGINCTGLIELVSEVGIVTWGTDGVFGVSHVSCNPRGKATFETAVSDNVVRWSGGASSATR